MQRLSLATLALGVLVVALVGGVAGAAVYATLFDSDNNFQRGEVLLLSPADAYPDFATTPACLLNQHVCLVPGEGGAVIALYTYDPHSRSRDRGCPVEWLPDFRFVDPESQENSTGWFRSPCSGSTFRMNGERVFGPAPRDLDRFPVQVRQEKEDAPDGGEITFERLEVDTRELICGAPIPGAPAGCEFAPLPQ